MASQGLLDAGPSRRLSALESFGQRHARRDQEPAQGDDVGAHGQGSADPRPQGQVVVHAVLNISTTDEDVLTYGEPPGAEQGRGDQKRYGVPCRQIVDPTNHREAQECLPQRLFVGRHAVAVWTLPRVCAHPALKPEPRDGPQQERDAPPKGEHRGGETHASATGRRQKPCSCSVAQLARRVNIRPLIGPIRRSVLETIFGWYIRIITIGIKRVATTSVQNHHTPTRLCQSGCQGGACWPTADYTIVGDDNCCS